jgi:hypothetical protein
MAAGAQIAVSGAGGTSEFYYVVTSSGLYYTIVDVSSQLSSLDWLVGSTTINTGSIKQITADTSDENIYMIDNLGTPLFYVLNGGGQGPLGTAIGNQGAPHPGYPDTGCPLPTDIAVDEELNVYVVGCNNNQFWVAPRAGTSWGTWKAYSVKGAANLVSIGANAAFGEQGPWVVDANGLTFQVFANGTSDSIARPEWIDNTAHTIGVYGPSNTAMAIGGDSEICQWTSRSGWDFPFLNGFGVQIAVQSYTAFVEETGNLYTYSNDLDP